MPFNLSLSLMYLIVGIAWGVLCFWFRYVILFVYNMPQTDNVAMLLTGSLGENLQFICQVFSLITYILRIFLILFRSDQLMPLQFWITGVMMVAMIETTMLYFHFIDWNEVRSLMAFSSFVI